MAGTTGRVERAAGDRDQDAKGRDGETDSRDQAAGSQDRAALNQEALNQAELDHTALESDARVERMDRVAVLFGEITAAIREFLKALAHSDRHRDWEEEGFGSCAEWLAWRIGITRGTANEKVRTALALEDLPLISEAMARGDLSFSKVRALTRAATPDNERELLEFALAGSAANLERLVRGWKTLSRLDEQQQERLRHSRRCFSVFPDEDGMYVVRGRLDPEVGAALMRAVEAASDALFAEASRSLGERRGSEARHSREAKHCVEAPEPAQLRADAVGLLAERALAAGFGAGNGNGNANGNGNMTGTGNVTGTGTVTGTVTVTGTGTGDQAPISGSRAERYQIVLHVEAVTLTEDREPGLSELEDGTRVSAETARRLSCDASRVVVSHGEVGSADGSGNGPANGSGSGSGTGSGNGSGNGSDKRSVRGPVLGAGRKTRTIPPALRRALDARDRGCRFPACGLRFTDAHHIVHWADGGETTLGNTLLLCRAHHRRVHEDGYRICTDRNGQIVFFTPTGKALFEAPQLPELPSDTPDPPDLLEALVRGNRERGITPDGSSCGPKWSRDSYIPWAIEAAARDAIDPWEESSAA